jgi:hypothetical protein
LTVEHAQRDDERQTIMKTQFTSVPKRPGSRWLLYVIAALLAMAGLACGWVGGSSDDDGGGVDEGPDFVVENVDPSPFCPDATVLSDGFKPGASGLADNELAAQQAADPQRRLEDYGSWGRVMGAYAQWSYVAPGTLSDEELAQLSEAEKAAYRERIAQAARENPFLAATCSVELYETGEGARRAFESVTEESRNPPPDAQNFTPAVSDRGEPAIGNQAVDLVYRYPTFNVFILIFRQRNVVASISVVASADTTAQYTQVLAEELALGLDEGLALAG